MKLRLRGNTVRLRLEQQEVSVLSERGFVEDGFLLKEAEGGFKYRLERGSGARWGISLAGSMIKVSIPLDQATLLVETDTTGLGGVVDEGTEFEVKITVEKDFQCLHNQSGEDESDLFPNPRANS